MEIFFSVGEPSGDEHAAELIRALQRKNPHCRCVGFGGEEMREAGCDLHFPLTTMAVMGIMKVLPLIRKFWNLGQQARRYFHEHRPDAVVLVDFPGFNWWIARYAREAGIPVYYYLPPQLWAWGAWRVKRMHKYVDHVLSGLDFEADWYREQGVEAEFVGHPFFEEVKHNPISREQIQELRNNRRQVIGLLPGSRSMEVSLNWPTMLKICQQLRQQHPELEFLVANYKPHQREECERLAREFDPSIPLEFHVGKTSEIIAAVDCCLMVSGSVSLELLARQTPGVVLYKAGFVMGSLAKRLIKCRYMTLPNLMADREMMPEFPFMGNDREVVQKASGILNNWLSHPQILAEQSMALQQLADHYRESVASEKTAEAILSRLDQQQPLSRAA
ncbi:MAG: lipid-A-disaccharide synthase [Planctomycetaceae bacterium]|nr:lipid-A-disaccharide synthase [Planctomycetaceae bacterium]